jgi:hypothetical protein
MREGQRAGLQKIGRMGHGPERLHGQRLAGWYGLNLRKIKSRDPLIGMAFPATCAS